MSCRILAVVLLLSGLGCSDEGADLRPCPPNGIGVEEHGGYSVAEQILQYQQYDCKEPQICPDNQIALYRQQFLIDPQAAPAQSTIGLTNCSTGNKRLVIEKAILIGDSRCSFTCQCRRDKRDPCQKCEVAVQKSQIDPGETISVMIEYQPTSAGSDHAAFQIFSNAQNFSPLVTPMCAWAVTSLADDTAADAGPSPDGSGALPRCELVTDVNTACHQD